MNIKRRDSAGSRKTSSQSSSKGKSLYSFYQNIIDKNNDGVSTQSTKDKLQHPKYKIEHKVPPKKIEEEKSPISAKESPSLVEKSSKFKNAGRDIVHKSPHDNLGKVEDIPESTAKAEKNLEEIIEENIDAEQRESIEAHQKEFHQTNSLSPDLLKTSKGDQFEESDGDGLINWALNLPEEVNMSHSSQFFKSPSK